ncbi:hypothetical protein D3C78_1191390 [compost metagenome]
MGGDLAFSSKGQRLLQILPCADDGAAHRDALQHRVENRNGDKARRQADKRHRPLGAEETVGLLHGLGRNRRHQRAMDTAGCLLHLLNCVRRAAIDGDIGSEFFRKRQLVVENIGGNDMHAHRLGILHGHVAKPANA